MRTSNGIFLKLSFIASLLFLGVDVVRAQDSGSSGTTFPFQAGQYRPVQKPTGGTADLTPCSSVLPIDAVSASVAAREKQSPAGRTAVFSGVVKNNSDVPLSGITVLARIVRIIEPGNGSETLYSVVGERYLADGLVLQVSGEAPLEFSWDIPSNAPTGKYEAVLMATVGDRVDQISSVDSFSGPGGSGAFEVKGGELPDIIMDRSSLRLNGSEIPQTDALPSFSKDGRVDASIELRNPTDRAVRAVISWSLYGQGSDWEHSLIDGLSESVALAPHESRRVTFPSTKAISALSSVRVEAMVGDYAVMTGQSFLRDGFAQFRLGAVGVERYPLSAEGTSYAYACYYSVGSQDVVADAHIVLETMDEAGNVTNAFDSVVRPSVFKGVVKQTVFSGSVSESFTVRARILLGDVVSDTKETVFRCQDIDPDSCSSARSESAVGRTPIGLPNGAVVTIGILILVTIVVGSAVYFLLRGRRKGKDFLMLMFAMATISVGVLPAEFSRADAGIDIDSYESQVRANGSLVVINSYIGTPGCSDTCYGTVFNFAESQAGEIGFGMGYQGIFFPFFCSETCSCPAGQTGSSLTRSCISSTSFSGCYPMSGSVSLGDLDWESFTSTGSCTSAVNGVCGPANGTVVASAPTANLCSSGSPSAVSGAGPWDWTCIGSGGGATAFCSAQQLIISTLRLCQNGIYYGSSTSPNTAGISIAQGESRNLTAYYDSGSGCSGT
ncbi:MAG TPA: hypothetical protein VN420_01590, partial [Candidatus Fimivivens sp.]|nr:hypothetical protein [Candidatus Fimivivens sp.]